MPSPRQSGVDNALPSLSLPVAASNAATSVKVPPMSAARRRSGRPAGNRDRFGDFIRRAELDCRAVAARRPYNKCGNEGKFAPPRGNLLGPTYVPSRRRGPTRHDGVGGGRRRPLSLVAPQQIDANTATRRPEFVKDRLRPSANCSQVGRPAKIAERTRGYRIRQV